MHDTRVDSTLTRSATADAEITAGEHTPAAEASLRASDSPWMDTLDIEDLKDGAKDQGQTVKLTENPVTQKKIQQKKIKKMDAGRTNINPALARQILYYIMKKNHRCVAITFF